MKAVVCLVAVMALGVHSQERRVGKLTEVFAWKQITYNIDGNILTQDRASAAGLERGGRSKRQLDSVYFVDNGDDSRWNTKYPTPNYKDETSTGNNFSTNLVDAPTPIRPTDNPSDFYIKYNNVPMGAEKVGDRLFITIPRRRYGIPSTLNYVDLTRDTGRSPALRPYPTLRESRSLTSVYRTRADDCGRLWLVDTGLLEIPDSPRQVQPPAIVVYDLQTDRQILRYQLKESDLPSNNTPTGLASIAVDTTNGCSNTFAYIPDLFSYGIVVYSLRENDSWRVTHNFMHFNPAASTLRIANQRFQWNDGIFSIALGSGRCRTAFFHPLISTQEFSVSTCVLNNRTASSDPNYWDMYTIVGERGDNSQSSMHDIHGATGVMFFAEVGRDAVSCWNSHHPMSPGTVAVLASDRVRLSYPADIHVTGDDVWVSANALPRFSYASLNIDEYNFFIYKGNVPNLIAGTACTGRPPQTSSHSSNNKYTY